MNLKRLFNSYFHNPNYLYFLISLILLILLPPFIYASAVGKLSFEIIYGTTLVLGSIHITRNYWEFSLSLLLSFTVFILFILNINNFSLGVLSSILSTALFILFFINLMKFMVSMKRVNANSLFACISGYILLGIVASMLFNLLSIYTRVLPFNIKGNNFYDLLYYSFTTITSVGYGDIVPITPLAKSITILVSISGQLYLTFLVGIIIGKYLVHDQQFKIDKK